MDVLEVSPGTARAQTPVPPFEPDASDWSLSRRILFRFVFCYFVLYNFPFPIGLIPGTSLFANAYTKMWHAILPWVGAHVLHLSKPIIVFANGSGDTTSDYVQLLCFVLLAAVATLVWTLLDGTSKQYSVLHEGLRVYIRYVLAFTLLSYGMAKVIKLQFISPGLEKLAEPFGDFSPMGLLWYFMGYSTGYTFFAGAAETIGGLLLFFRRTTTLGAIVISGVMLNVVALNYFYDTPVKLYSTNLELMAIFLLIPALPRLANVLLLNRAAEPVGIAFPWLPPGSARWVKISRVAVKSIVIGLAVYLNTLPNIAMAHQYANMPRSPLYGIYDVQGLARMGSPGVTEPNSDIGPWKILVFERPTRMAAVMSDNSMRRFQTDFNVAKSSFVLSTGGKEGQKLVFTYSRPDANHLVLQGLVMKQPVTIKLQKIDESKFLLPSRGFHWINEYPLNR